MVKINKIASKVLSAFMAMVLVAGLFPASALAVGDAGVSTGGLQAAPLSGSAVDSGEVAAQSSGSDFKNLTFVSAEGSLALAADGSLWEWAYVDKPVKVLEHVVSYSAKDYLRNQYDGIESDLKTVGAHAAVTESGEMYLWNVDAGYVGGDSSDSITSPRKVQDGIAQVACGRDFGVAFIKSDGTLWIWGEGGAQTKLMDRVSEVSLGSSEKGLALDVDGAVWQWASGESPQKILEGAVSVSAGTGFAAIKADATLWTWGQNDSGCLGTGSTNDASSPTKVLDKVAQVSMGTMHSGAVCTDGSLWMWGDNTVGELGDGSYSASLVPVKIGEGYSQISANGTTFGKSGVWNVWSSAVTDTGLLTAWGVRGTRDGNINIWGKAHNGLSYVSGTAPMQCLTDVSDVAIGRYHMAVLRKNGTLWTWGENAYGQLGDGTTKGSYAPKQVMADVVSVAIADGYGYPNDGSLLRKPFSAAVKRDGSLWMWGSGVNDLLYGSGGDALSPVRVLEGVADVSASGGAVLIRKNDGALWFLGYGIPGDGNAAGMVRNPVQVMSGISLAVVGNEGFNCAAVDRDGGLFTWGDMSLVGNGVEYRPYSGDDNVVAKTPQHILDGVQDVSVGWDMAMALTTTGTVYGWSPQRNDSTYTEVSVPQVIASGKTDIGANGNVYYAVSDGGMLSLWGADTAGIIGVFSYWGGVFNAIPVDDAIEIASGVRTAAFSCKGHLGGYVTQDSKLWTWGNNCRGCLGYGWADYQNIPLTIAGTTARGISGCTVSLAYDSVIYDGSAKEPAVVVKRGASILRKNADYSVDYSNNINAGTATVTVVGKGNYVGTKTASFTIAKAEPSLSFASASLSKTLASGTFTNLLTKTTDGTVTYRSSNASVATVNSATGLVTPKGAGTTTITATAAEGANYKAGSASYALTVTRPVTYTVTYNANGGTGTPSAQVKQEGEMLTLSDIEPSKAYLVSYNANGGSVSPASKSVMCVFKGWNTMRNGGGISYSAGGSYAADADATLYAQWTNPVAGSLATPLRSGYDFMGWFTSATGGMQVDASSAVTGNTTLYAHWVDPYNMGDETYSFKNYRDSDADGHCFGMSMTSAGYHNGLIDIGRIGGNSNTPLYSFADTQVVREPICYYQGAQGDFSKRAIVAGGSTYLNQGNNIAGDWQAVVDYVKRHDYDGTGLLQIGFRGYGSNGWGGHAINFLRYESVNGQDRIYAYDNNYLSGETYFYEDASGRVRQAPFQTFDEAITCIALRDVRTYYASVGDFDATHVVYMPKDATTVQGYSYSYMDSGPADDEYVMYEIPADQNRITIIPHRDNADFIYMGTEYSFEEVTANTRGELRLASLDEGAAGLEPSFTVYEVGSVVPTLALSKDSYTYDGVAHKPTVTVKAKGTLLRESQDYTIEYPAGMVNVGKYEIKVTLCGNYSGSVTKTFEIKAASLSPVSLKTTSATYDGKAHKPALKSVKAGSLSVPSSGYKVEYLRSGKTATDFKSAGSITVRVTGKGNFAGSKTATFKIKQAANPLAAKAVTKTVKLPKGKKALAKATSVLGVVKLSKTVIGAVTYAKVSKGSAKCLSINKKTGKITVAKNTKAGTYKLKVTVKAAGDKNHKAKTQALTLTVKVMKR